MHCCAARRSLRAVWAGAAVIPQPGPEIHERQTAQPRAEITARDAHTVEIENDLDARRRVTEQRDGFTLHLAGVAGPDPDPARWGPANVGVGDDSAIVQLVTEAVGTMDEYQTYDDAV